MIEVETKFTKEAIHNYYRFTEKRNTKDMIIYAAILVALAVAVCFLTSVDALILPLIIVLFCVVIIAFLAMLGGAKKKTDNLLKQMPRLLETEYSLVFNKDYMQISYSCSLESGKHEIKYELVDLVYEVADYFYFHIRNSFYIIDKKDFTHGTPEELSALLRSVMPDTKYKNREK